MSTATGYRHYPIIWRENESNRMGTCLLWREWQMILPLITFRSRA